MAHRTYGTHETYGSYNGRSPVHRRSFIGPSGPTGPIPQAANHAKSTRRCSFAGFGAV